MGAEGVDFFEALTAGDEVEGTKGTRGTNGNAIQALVLGLAFFLFVYLPCSGRWITVSATTTIHSIF